MGMKKLSFTMPQFDTRHASFLCKYLDIFWLPGVLPPRPATANWRVPERLETAMRRLRPHSVTTASMLITLNQLPGI